MPEMLSEDAVKVAPSLSPLTSQVLPLRAREPLPVVVTVAPSGTPLISAPLSTPVMLPSLSTVVGLLLLFSSMVMVFPAEVVTLVPLRGLPSWKLTLVPSLRVYLASALPSLVSRAPFFTVRVPVTSDTTPPALVKVAPLALISVPFTV